MKASPRKIDKHKKKPTVKRNTFFAVYVFALVGILVIAIGSWLIISAIHPQQTKHPTVSEAPKGIDWFYNRSSELAYLKSRIDYIDNQTAAFIKKHGTDETGYDQSEKDKMASLKMSRNMISSRFNEMAADYNAHAIDMNRSWNKTIPRQIYDMPT